MGLSSRPGWFVMFRRGLWPRHELGASGCTTSSEAISGQCIKADRSARGDDSKSGDLGDLGDLPPQPPAESSDPPGLPDGGKGSRVAVTRCGKMNLGLSGEPAA